MLNVFLTHRPGGAYSFISDGWLNALLAVGINAKRWDGKLATWDEFDPDLYIAVSGHVQPIPIPRRAHIVCHVNPYGPKVIGGISESESSIRWVLGQKPIAVFGYGHEYDRALWSHWTVRHGIPWVPMATAGDSTIFSSKGGPRDIRVGYVGGFWPYKGKNINTYLMPVIEKGIVSVRGWGDWPKNCCGGPITDDAVPAFFRSCRVGACISEPHTHEYGIDLPERAFKVALSGALIVHDPAKGLDKYIPSALIGRTAEEYLGLCALWSSNEMQAEREKLAEQQRREVLSRHTYFHRMTTLFKSIEQSSPKFKEAAELLEQRAKQEAITTG